MIGGLIDNARWFSMRELHMLIVIRAFIQIGLRVERSCREVSTRW